MSDIDLRHYDNSWYDPGRSVFWRALWMFAGLPFFRSALSVNSAVRVALLRCFGASIGDRVVIRQGVVVKYPWHLVIANDCWIGEAVWIDNLTTVRLGNNVCLSQGAYLCTGNHDWSDPFFGLIVRGITLDDGAWAGARSLLLPGISLGRGAIAAAGSVVTHSVEPWAIVAGNPAALVRHRVLRQASARSEHAQEVLL